MARPHRPGIRDLYGRLVGSWDVESSIAGAAEWHFARILGGLAVQDTIFPAGAPPERHGLTIRSYDARAGVWHVFYTAPGDDEFVTMVGRPEGDGIVQLGHDVGDPGTLRRWSFHDITPTSFRWTGERSPDRGTTWICTHEMRATRRAVRPQP